MLNFILPIFGMVLLAVGLAFVKHALWPSGFKFKSRTSYFAVHIITGRQMVIIGVDPKTNTVVTNDGHVISITECYGFKERGHLTPREMQYLERVFGHQSIAGKCTWL